MEDKGLPGREVMVTYIEILEELGHQFPREWAASTGRRRWIALLK